MALPVMQPAPVTQPAPTPTLVVGTGFPRSPPAEDYLPEWVKEMRRTTGESYFTGAPDQFFRLQPQGT